MVTAQWRAGGVLVPLVVGVLLTATTACSGLDVDETASTSTTAPAGPPTTTVPVTGHDHPATTIAPPPVGVLPVDRVLRGDESFPDGFTVPADQVWEFAPEASTTVQSSANVVVEGVLRMRPATPDVLHTLRFVGIDESRFVGGGHEVLATDVGLWVTGAGQLDLAGSPRAGWNRAGTDPTWRPDDDIRVAPNAPGASDEFAPFEPGSPVPTVTYAGRSYATEVLNLTRNVVIEGTGDGEADPSTNGRAHIWINSSQPQSIRYAELRHLGPRRPDPENNTVDVLGRYALHFHMAGEGSRGSTVEGVVVRDSGGHAFVPHASHGITFRDTIAFNTFEDAYWWDPDDTGHGGEAVNATNDLLYEHAMAALVRSDPTFRGYTLTGFRLGEGRNLTVTDSVGVGIQGNKGASSFHWPADANGNHDNMWTFADNVGHNNNADGIFVWQNDGNPHHVDGFVGYRNGDFGVDHGAYVNNYRYEDIVVFENGGGGINHRAGSGDLGELGQSWRNVDTDSITLAEHSLPTEAVVFDRMTLRGPIVVDEESAAHDGNTTYEFRNVHTADGQELTPASFQVLRQVSRIVVYRSDGTSFEI